MNTLQYYFFKDSISGLQRIKKIGALEHKHLSKFQKDSLNSNNQNGALTSQTKGFNNRLNTIIGIGFLLLLLILALFYFNKNEKVGTPKNEIEDNKKLEQYFKELYEHLNQSQSSTFRSTYEFEPKDMTEFLSNNLNAPKDWEYFEHYFEKVHKDFFKILKSTYPKISTNELNMCALLKLNIRNKDIAKIMGISPESVRKAQHRLSKKLEIPENEILRDFVLKL